MGAFDPTSSPLLVLSPQHPHSPSFQMASNRANRPAFTAPFPNSVGIDSQNASGANHATLSATTPSSAAGRKRSRDDAGENLDDEYFAVRQPMQMEATPEKEDEWEYGEGMTLIKPTKSGYIMPAESQTGTWAEEKAEQEAQAASRASTPERPIIRTAKSQRLDHTATPTIAEEATSNGPLGTPLSAASSGGLKEPIVDEFTRHLGIGWSLISADADIQAAARGWDRFINNHFPITDAKIRLQSKGLASYLVEAGEGFFLFGEDLKQGRLVSVSLEKTWANLQGPVPVFDGEAVLEAGATPKFNGGSPSPDAVMAQDGLPVQARETTQISEVNGSINTVTAPPTLEVEMDMS